MTAMRLFVDESECRQSQRYYIGALLCGDSQVAAISKALNDLAAICAPELGLCPDEAEFHGYEVCQGMGAWSPLHKHIERRIDVCTQFAKLIGAINAKFYVKAVRQNLLQVRGDHEITLLYLLEEIDRQSRREGIPVGAISIACDQINIQALIRRGYASARQYGTGGWKPTRLESFADHIEFIDSRASRQIQAVDMILYFYRRIKFYEFQIADGKSLNKNKMLELKALRRLLSCFAACMHVCPTWHPAALR